MALEAVVFPHNLLPCNLKEFYGLTEEEEQAYYGNSEVSYSSMNQRFEDWNSHSSNLTAPPHEIECAAEEAVAGEKNVDLAAGVQKRSGRKRRRNKTLKNKEEAENQRMTHIAVERNRRKQMNYYLSLLRSLMPPSYVQRGDQASIISGAINFVKELQHFNQLLQLQKQLKQHINTGTEHNNPLASSFTSPQYSSPPSMADIEVGIMEGHANLKLLSQRRPKQLLKLVMGLQSLQLTILHLNVASVEPMVLYSFSLKVEDDCRLNSADEIAAAVHEIVLKNREEAAILLR